MLPGKVHSEGGASASSLMGGMYSPPVFTTVAFFPSGPKTSTSPSMTSRLPLLEIRKWVPSAVGTGITDNDKVEAIV